MKKETHKQITEALIEGFGEKGISSILGAMLTLLGVALFVTGANLPVNTDYKTLLQLTVMLYGFMTLIASILYNKVTTLIYKVSDYKTPTEMKIISALLTAYIYAVAVATLFKM